MNHRVLVSVSVLTVLIAVMFVAAMPAAGQAGSAPARTGGTPAKAYRAPRTPDGQPDLQGFWTNTTYTPLERPKNVTKDFFTKEEAIEIAKQAAEVEGEQTEPGTIADVHYDFTQFALDRSQGAGAVLNLRSSMIVDPPDGRIPPMTAEGQKRTAERAEARRRSRGRRRHAHRTASPICRAFGRTPRIHLWSDRRTSTGSFLPKRKHSKLKDERPKPKVSRRSPEPLPTCTTTLRSLGWTGTREGSP